MVTTSTGWKQIVVQLRLVSGRAEQCLNNQDLEKPRAVLVAEAKLNNTVQCILGIAVYPQLCLNISNVFFV